MKKFRIDLTILGFVGADCLASTKPCSLPSRSFSCRRLLWPALSTPSSISRARPEARSPAIGSTVADASHNTGLRVNLPKPNCSMRPSDCEDLEVINTLDGFNLQPRLSIPFDGPIDAATVTSHTIFLISLGTTLRHGDHGGMIIGINQVIWDPATNTEWVFQSGDALAYAPHIRQNPLAGVPAKPVILQFANGDQTSPNSAMTAILRAGNLADRATFYRHELAVAANPALPRNPHPFIININVAAFREVALGAQQQIALFFASDGNIIIHPEPARFFEVPIVLPLPEDLNYIP